jgi:serine/threonine-protein kinase
MGVGEAVEVYDVFDSKLERRAALKLGQPLQGDEVMRANALKQFEQEAQTASRLDHPNVLPIVDYGVHEDQLFCVMPYFDGQSILRWAITERPSHAQWLNVFSLVFAALSHAHKQGVLHGDIKSSNVLVRGSASAPEVKLNDWGVAPALRQGAMRGAGELLGSSGSIDPALLRDVDRGWSAKSDLFAAGVLMYRLMCEADPVYVLPDLAADKRVAIFQQNDVTVPNYYVPHIDPGLEAFMMRLLSSEPERRPESAEEAWGHCAQLAQDIPSDVHTDPPILLTERKTRTGPQSLRPDDFMELLGTAKTVPIEAA